MRRTHSLASPSCPCCSRRALSQPTKSSRSRHARLPIAPREGRIPSHQSGEAKQDRITRLQKGGDHIILITNACILTMDAEIGDFEQGSILIKGQTIRAVGANIEVDADIVVDASGMIALPGFVDTHRHCWQNVFRRFAPNATLESYGLVANAFGAVIEPDDVRIANLLSCLGAMDSGVTTMLDWSHISRTPEHSDGAIEGLRQSGIRAVYGYAKARMGGEDDLFPNDLARLHRNHFASDDQLVTLALGANINQVDAWASARDMDLRITAHVLQPHLLEEAGQRGLLGPDVTYIHCTTLSDRGWQMIADTGGTLSLATPSIGQLGVGGGGIPPVQKALDHGIRPSLSVDVEFSLMGDFFTQMRSTLLIQRVLANEIRLKNGDGPRLLTARDVLEFATVEGARANGMLSRIGTLTPGKQADLILIDANAINTMPLNNAVGTVVSGADTSNVDSVFIAGRAVKFAGRLLDVDLEKIRREVYESRERVMINADVNLDILGDGV